ncbi:primosomal protein [Antrihabitans cavernicola]|uniref:Primosomal protein n=1 Tax=Antrihabitans cavernicola TaxID=2495913 RepID=A0A5A7S9U7_9NOCA|nr:primosomal protein [Spelaeibacter cavernicola]KAA0022676.1 primosomal protein [Spelaeibacter cavernicola]
MAAGDIVPIELGLTDGDLVTLWAPRWREGDDEWEAFLGHEDDLYGFESIAELAAFIRTDDDNDLVEHPSWNVVSALSAAELEPDENFCFDLVGVPELAASDPDADTVTELEDTLNMVRNIGEVCELDKVIRFFSNNPILGALPGGVNAFGGREGEALWDQIGSAISKDWDQVLDAIDTIVKTPDVDKSAIAVAEAELLAAGENTVDADDVADESDDDEDHDADETAVGAAGAAAVGADADDEDDLDDEEDDSFWHAVGIDPIKIITSAQTYYTLRCYLDDDPIFLGTKGAITVFTSERALARYLADNHDHDLSKVSTYSDVQTAAVDGSLEVEVTDENVYVLTGLADDLASGPDAIDAEQLDLAVELFTDAADYADDDSVEQALAPSAPLGWYVSFALNPDPTRMAPSPPFDTEADAWRALDREFEARLQPR